MDLADELELDGTSEDQKLTERRGGTPRAFVSVTVVFGALVVGAGAIHATSLALATLALFCAAAALSEYFQVEGDDEHLDPTDARTFSFSSGVHLAAVVVAGPWVAAIAAAFGVLFVDRLRRVPLPRVAFNASVFALATAAGAFAFSLAGGSFGRLELPEDLPALAAMAVTYSVVNSLLVGVVLALAHRAPIFAAAREALQHDWTSDAAEAALGALLAFVLLREAWAVVLLAPLALAAYHAHARLALVRRETARALETFANVVDERDAYTFRHSARVAEYVEQLAEALHLPPSQVARLRWAGRLHDLGKVAVDASVLRRPGKLEADDWTVMKRHPRLSARILRRFHLAGDQAQAVEFHHERFDGRGYYGVAGRDVPLASHFLVIADSYDAMTSDRPYRKALSSERAQAEIAAGSGTQFHPLVAKAFLALQRGQDPALALSPAERAELARAFPGTRLRDRIGAIGMPPAEGAVLWGGVAVLGLAGAGLPLLAAVPGVAVVCGLVFLRWSMSRARRLGERVALELKSADAFAALTRALSTETPLTWSGLVRWDGAHLSGTLEREWNELGVAPGEAALTSWLVRESDRTAELLEARGAELGARGTALALPLAPSEADTGFLVLCFDRRVPRHVRQVLATLPSLLEDSLMFEPRPAPLRAAS